MSKVRKHFENNKNGKIIYHNSPQKQCLDGKRRKISIKKTLAFKIVRQNKIKSTTDI